MNRRATYRTALSTALVAAWGVIVVAGVLGVVAPSSSRAADGSNDRALGGALQDLEWGDSKSQVLEKLKARQLEALRNRDDLRHDRVELQQARKRVLEQFEDVEESYTKLKGDETGYEVSVVAGEYTKDNNEALLRVKDDMAQRFYFFLDGDFYKMVVAYNQSYLEDVEFARFVKRASRKYGTPEATETARIADEQVLAYARWRGESTILEIENQKEFFGTYTMIFSDRNKIEKLAEKERSFGGSDKKKKGVSKRVEALSVDSEADSNEGVVSGMIGESVEVDLGSDEETSTDEQGPTSEGDKTTETGSKQAQASEQDESSKDEDDESDETDDDDRDFSDISSDSEQKDEKDDELIVY
jgi:hypothetical protein